MMNVENSSADVLMRDGWLSRQPKEFQVKVLASCVLQQFGAGETIYSVGDPPGGIYGLVEGALGISIAPGVAGPYLVHLANPGSWFGEAPFLTGEPRRVHLEAMTLCRLAHLPLAKMEMLASEDAYAIRYFARISVYHIDNDLLVIEDLLQPDPTRRVAAILWRSADGLVGPKLTITQAGLSHLANTSRKETLGALKKLCASGAVRQHYRTIEIVDRKLLRQIADGPA